MIVADQAGLRHFRVGDLEGRLLQLLDGERSLPAVHGQLAREFPESGLSFATVHDFTARLETLGLLEGSALPPPRRTLSRGSIFYLQVPLGNPERFLRLVVDCCPFLFTPAFWSAVSVLMLAALWIATSSWPELMRDGLHFHSLAGLLLVWGSLSLLTTIHELGHGLTSTYYGAPARSWGLLFMYLVLPGAYCDVSAAWTLPKKSQRLAVGAAGLAFQWVAGAVALILWRVMEPGTLAARSLATMAAACGITSLLNLWPFLRLDGYYMLSDVLEIPNLRTRALTLLRGRLSAFLLGGAPPEAPNDTREARILTLYGLGAAAWTVVMLWIVGERLLGLIVGWWGGSAVLAAGLALLAFRSGFVSRILESGLRIVRHGSGETQRDEDRTMERPAVPEMGREGGEVSTPQKGRRGALPVLALGLGALLLLGRWELNVSSPCRLEAARRVPVRSLTDGVLGEFRFREGDRVRKGAILGTLETFETREALTQLEARLRMVRAEREAIEIRLPVAKAQTDQLTAETRAGLERARTDLVELAEDLPQRVREAASRTAEAAADADQADAALEEARAAVEAQSRTASRLRADHERALAGDYPPAIAALSERLQKCRADRELAERDRNRSRQLVSQGALAAQSLDRAAAAAAARTREEEAARGDQEAGLNELREAAEDAEAELTRRQAALRAARAGSEAAGAARDAASQAELRVRAQSRPGQLTSAQRQLEAQGEALTAAVAQRGELDARRKEIAARRLEAERLRSQIAVLRRRLRASALRSPVSGVLTTPRIEERIGRQFDKGTTICQIEQPTMMSARIFVPEKEIGAVFVGAPVSLKVAPFPTRTFTGRVTEIAPTAQPRGNLVACEVRIRVANPKSELRAGMSGWAKIACGKQPIGALFTRRVVRYVRTEAWSWF